MVKPVLAFSMVCAAFAVSAAEKNPQAEELFKAYSEMNYPAARKLAKASPDLLEAKLVGGLCDLYDQKEQNIKQGQQAMAEIFFVKDNPPAYRQLAGVSLARTAQLMKQRREQYGTEADQYNHLKIFQQVIDLDPTTEAARDAFFYMIYEELETPELQEAGFEKLEKFLSEFKGDKTLLPPIHRLAEYEYIRQRRDYKNGVRHLKAGYDIGFANPSVSRSAAFRLPFLLYKKIGDKEQAIEYFKLYLKRHPFSAQAVVAKRFLKELGVGEQNK